MYTCIYICAQSQENLFDTRQYSFFWAEGRAQCLWQSSQPMSVCHTALFQFHAQYLWACQYLWPLSSISDRCPVESSYACVSSCMCVSHSFIFLFFPFFPADAQYLRHLFCRVSMCVCVTIFFGAQHPRVEWRGLKIGGGSLIHRKVVFCIFRCQSIWVGISSDDLSSRIFWRNYKFQD